MNDRFMHYADRQRRRLMVSVIPNNGGYRRRPNPMTSKYSTKGIRRIPR